MRILVACWPDCICMEQRHDKASSDKYVFSCHWCSSDHMQECTWCACIIACCKTVSSPYLMCRNFGELCCMKLILSELQRDLRHRLAVYTKNESAGSRMTDKRHALLQNSQLWRLLQVRPLNYHPEGAKQLCLHHMRTISCSAG